MKVKTLSLMAGASVFALSAGALGAVEFSVEQFAGIGDDTYTFSQWHADNGLQTAKISLTATQDIQLLGLISGDNGWNFTTTDGNGFFNYSEAPFHSATTKFTTDPAFDGFFSDPESAQYDSGLSFETNQLWSSLFANDINPGSFGAANDGSSESSGSVVWGSLPSGISLSAGETLHLATITWGELEEAFVSFAAVTITPEGDHNFIGEFDAVPAPGALALLGLAGLAGARRRRA